MAKTPLILEIKGNSLDDGPGIRGVIFFKGCPLDCVWCHNPESKSPNVEISYDPDRCIACDTCIETCPVKAISKENLFFIDRSKCILCFECVDNCPSGALEKVGTEMSVKEVFDTIIKYEAFYKSSGGGVTLSGGEPTMHMEFISELLGMLKKKGIHTLVETCGHFNLESFMTLVYPLVDTLYYDIKLFNEDEHRKYCGVSNKKILENFKALNKMSNKDTMELVPRTPLVPRITDTRSNMEAIATFLKSLGIRKAQLLAYNPLWHKKNYKIGKKSILYHDPAMTRFMGADRLEQCKNIFRQNRICV